MVVRCKEEVYSWFRNLDSSNRIDFFCTLLTSYCNPWEIRFFGTCLEQSAKSSHHVLKEHDFATSDYKELEERMLQSHMSVLDQTDDLRQLVMGIALLRSRPSDASCSNIASNIMMEIHRTLQSRLASISSHTELAKTQLIEDVRLLLAIAIHHPAFSFHQRELFKSQLDGINKIFGLSSADDLFSDRKDVECQTESSEGCCHITDSGRDGPTSENRYASNSLLVADRNPERCWQYYINDLKLVNTRSCKSELIYKIEVRYNNCEQLLIEKSHKDIKHLHEKMLAAFPDDVKSLKHIQNIPLLKGHDSSDMAQRYIRDLCKMKPEFLQCQIMHEFFLPVNRLPKSDSLPKGDTARPKVVDARLIVDADENSESESLTLPMQTVIVTNSSKYSLPTTSLNGTTGLSQARSPTGSHIPSSQMLQMSKSDLKAKGMVDGAAKKLSDKLNIVRSTGNINNQEFKDLVQGKPGHVKATFLHSPESNHREELLFLGDTPAQVSLEIQKKSEIPLTDIQLAESPSNLYAFPSPQRMVVSSTASTDASQRKSPRESIPLHSTDDSHHPVGTSTDSTVIHNSSAITSLNSSTTSKGNKRSTKPTSFSQHSPRSQGSSHSGSRQKNESKGSSASSAGKSLTVEEIQQRQRQQHAMQRQQSSETVIQMPISQHCHHSLNVSNAPQPPTSHTLPPAQHQTTAHVSVSVSSLPATHSAHTKQMGSQKVHASTLKVGQVQAQSQGTDNQQPTTKPESHQHHKNKVTQLSLPTQVHSPLPSGNALRSPEGLSPEVSDESDGFTVADHDVSEKQSKVLKACKSSESPDMSTDADKRRTSQGETVNEDGENKESVGIVPPATVMLQQPFLPAAVDDTQYISVNGYKSYSFPPQDMDRVLFSGPDGPAAFVSNNCSCPKCAGGYYVSIPGGPPPRPSHSPSPMPPQHQNGIVYGFPSGFMPPSNGMINPAIHSFNRPNGMVQRNDVIYHQLPFIPANTPRPGYPAGPAPHFQQPPNYNPFHPPSTGYKKRVLHCTNCGMSNHTRNECSEPVDNSAYINEYHLDMQPRTELSE
ncbi:zinc finger CCHC domain-containing protein 2-like [Watersipora subatra]|uniref:zinc finger CCHC domain-containing protein 2-like n=1 Tax=Watersipora subatra TaxID=2589382 RepID=UPI00355C0A19